MASDRPAVGNDGRPAHALHEKLERMRREATLSFDRMLETLVEIAVSMPQTIQESKPGHLDFVFRLMVDVYHKDLDSHLNPEDAGWRTIHQFYRRCNKVRPGWASKQTFYHRMNSSLLYLLAQDVAQKRAIKKRLGKGRAKYEFRINPDHPTTSTQGSEDGSAHFV